MSELSFLLDLLLNEKLSKAVKEKITERIKLFEQNLTLVKPVVLASMQAPSTIAALQRQAAEVGQVGAIETPAGAITTVKAAMAIQDREKAIAQAQSGKPEPGRTSPRKF